MTEKFKRIKDRVEEAIPNHFDSYEVDYWKEENDDGVEIHGLDLTFTGSALELFYEPVNKDWKNEEDIMNYISRVLYFDHNNIKEIQKNLSDYHE